MFSAWEFALAGQIASHAGIVFNREAKDDCRTCRVTVRRKNMFRHVASRSHRRAFHRAWKAHAGTA